MRKGNFIMKIRKIRWVAASLLLPLLASSAIAMDDSEMILQREGKALRFESNSTKEQPVLSTPSDTASALRVAGIWLVLLGAVGGALVYLRKKQKLGGVAAGTSARLTLVERLPLGPNRELLLVRACDRLLVVSSLANQMSLLSDLPTEDSASQPFAGVLKNREQKAETSSRELREAPPARVQLQQQFEAALQQTGMPQQIKAAMQPREPRRMAPPAPPVAAVPAWPDMENAR